MSQYSDLAGDISEYVQSMHLQNAKPALILEIYNNGHECISTLINTILLSLWQKTYGNWAEGTPALKLLCPPLPGAGSQSHRAWDDLC